MPSIKAIIVTLLFTLLYALAFIDIPVTFIADQAAKKHGLDPKLFRAVIRQESNWNSMAISPKGAVGLAQLMPAAAQDCGLEQQERYSPYYNLNCGAWHLAKHYQEFKSVEKALCAYNAGASRVRRFGACPPYPETQQYVRNIMTHWQQTSTN
ncbi:soluble lytic murein transglycosylase-like protein [Beggiatoa alba B18LD]|uniref:Soluble lytic murein transglycosylase-like protein n=1 Tax=Beggiatoa alba B18LD TaxID=395493 RepID=I3CHG1_9GAMM|nr:lytic transglycosylase domain-containing protein [Beggiatoa alba]EIJ43054.1 soluble lytic murein transglycosylase-like protein [Beggiatoa alba B18LD]